MTETGEAEEWAEFFDQWPHSDEERQSTTACCPRETIPDSCSCPDGCECLCRDCECENWGDDDDG